MRILIVDDDDLVCKLFAEILTRADYEVVTTDSAFGVARLVRDVRPSAVILDIGLPFRPGTSLIEELKSDPATASVPVVVVSGLPGVLSEERRLEVTAVIEKPVDAERLLTIVADACARR